jgi:hypothetical protein
VTARLIAANLRDLSYIASRLRPEDHAEVSCQFDEWTPTGLASVCLRDHAYVVEIGGNPEAAVGATRVNSGLWIAWSWGSPRMARAVPIITRFVHDIMMPDIVASGGWRCEARAMASHTSAHRWLKRMGATQRCVLPRWGRNGEDFILFDWTRDDVLQSIQDADAACASAPAGNAAAGHGHRAA